MKPRQQRMLAVGLAVVGIAVAAAMGLQAVDKNTYFRSVTQVAGGDYPQDRNFRIGGLVVEGSIAREEGSLEVNFLVTDTRCEVPVSYTGVLPDLFRDGQGVVATGSMAADGRFVAEKIFAKHDENYMAPEVAESIAKHVADQTADVRENPSECDYS